MTEQSQDQTPPAQPAPEPDQFVLELENISPGQRTVMTDPVGPVCLHFPVGTRSAPSRLPITPDQFFMYRYDIEHRVKGIKGMAKEFDLWAVNVRTGERQVITFDQACAVVSALDPKVAQALQEAKRAAYLAEVERKRKAQDTGGGMRGAARAVFAAQAQGSPGEGQSVDIDLGG